MPGTTNQIKVIKYFPDSQEKFLEFQLYIYKSVKYNLFKAYGISCSTLKKSLITCNNLIIYK